MAPLVGAILRRCDDLFAAEPWRAGEPAAVDWLLDDQMEPWKSELAEVVGLLEEVEPDGDRSPDGPTEAAEDEPAAVEEPAETAELKRLCRLVLASWCRVVDAPRSDSRPDVLAIASDFLADANAPHTVAVVRYAVVLCLRALYGVDYDKAGIDRLHVAHGVLQSRFGEQKRRRHRKRSQAHEDFLLDVMAIEGYVCRKLNPGNLAAYCESFRQYPLGVAATQRRPFREEGKYPELVGTVPDFPTALNKCFAMPVGLPGFDEVLGGLLPAVRDPDRGPWHGGLVTLVEGRPGTGKTSFCLSIGARMAELGSTVRYLTTEESEFGLEARRSTIVEAPVAALWPELAPGPTGGTGGNFQVIDGKVRSLEALVSSLTRELDRAAQGAKERPSDPPGNASMRPVHLVFPRVVIVDSLTTLLGGTEPLGVPGEGIAAPALTRPVLNDMLNRLREYGVCIFLVAGLDDSEKHGLSFLVDNVFRLQLEDSEKDDNHITRRHPLRVLAIEKTRLQISHRGRHIFHLSRHDGCAVSPSFHSVIRTIKDRESRPADKAERAVLWTAHPRHRAPAALPLFAGIQELDSGTADRQASRSDGTLFDPLLIRQRSQVLIYGKGSSGKARMALAWAFEPRVRTDRPEFREYLARHNEKQRPLFEFEESSLNRERVLVVSFLYGKRYYEEVVRELARHRFRRPNVGKDFFQQHLEVQPFYPGFLDPETLLARIRGCLARAALEGRPFTAAVLDGIHNILLQFPLLLREHLLWPTLYRLFRTEGVSAFSTFTFFSIARLVQKLPHTEGDSKAPGYAEHETPRFGDSFAATEHLFYHMLVSSCDYTFVVERPASFASGYDRNLVRVGIASTADGFGREPSQFYWNPTELRYEAFDPAE